MARAKLVVSAVSLALCVACAAKRPAQVVRFEPEVVTGDPSLEKLNDEELFAAGSAKVAAAEYADAARYFDRLVESFPDSRHHRAAALQAGLAYQRLQQWEAALERFAVIADPTGGEGEALDASFRMAETLYHLDRFAEAAEVLGRIAARDDLAVARRIEAQVQLGVCQLESGAPADAERTLRATIETWEGLPDRSEVDDYFPGQAQFFLGEIYRLHYQEVALDPSRGSEKLGDDLEYKAQLLLSAQGHYLRAIRVGNGYWATAAGTRIGGLYEDLYQRMISSPAPPELNEAEAELYREELRKRVRVLLTKAISVYERTLEAAERIGAQTPFVETTRESLKKVKDLLLADVAPEPAEATSPEPRT